MGHAMTFHDLTTPTGCRSFVIDRRWSCRRLVGALEPCHETSRAVGRKARRLRETKEPMLIRRADVIEASMVPLRDTMRSINQRLVEFGRELMRVASFVNAQLPQPALLTLLNVNRADCVDLPPEAGLIEITHIYCLEDSAMHRDSDLVRGPLGQAISRFMNHELLHNEKLAAAMHEHVFGKGGMFEFVPTYRMGPGGEMIRQPPKLREADANCDSKPEAA